MALEQIYALVIVDKDSGDHVENYKSHTCFPSFNVGNEISFYPIGNGKITAVSHHFRVDNKLLFSDTYVTVAINKK